MIKIRKATIKDFNSIKKLEQEFYLKECRKDKLCKPEYAYGGLPAYLGKSLRSKNCVFFVAEHKNKVIGFAGSCIEKIPAFFKYKKRGHIFYIYIRKEYRNKKIGSELLKESLKWFKKKKIKYVKIMTYWFNTGARKLYKKLGFKDYIYESYKMI